MVAWETSSLRSDYRMGDNNKYIFKVKTLKWFLKINDSPFTTLFENFSYSTTPSDSDGQKEYKRLSAY